MKKQVLITTLAALFTSFAQPARADLQMLFSNAAAGYDPSEIYITLGSSAGAATGVNYSGNSFTWNDFYADSVSLATIGSGGLTWTGNASSVVVFVSYGTSLPASMYGGTNAFSQISYNNPSDPSFPIPYQNFEITYNGTPGDQGNITAINYYGASMNIKSYGSANATGTPLQEAGFITSTANVASQLAAISGNNPSVAMTNSSGNVVRYVGPTQPGYNPPGHIYGSYPSFDGYLSAMQTSSNKTLVKSGAAFNSQVATGGTNTYTNAQVNYNLTNVVQQVSTVSGGVTNTSYALQALGDIEVVYTSYTNGVFAGTTTNTYNNIQLTVDPNGVGGSQTNNPYADVASSFIYSGDAGAGTNYVSVHGGDWDTFVTDMNPYVNGAGASNIVGQTISSQIMGDVATGFTMGLVGSTATNSQFGNTPLGELSTGEWWTMTNVKVFSDIQSSTNFYNQYANIIYQASSNTVYGTVYSDRFGASVQNPLINSVMDGTNPVGSWLVTIGDPIGAAVPEPTAAMFVILGVMGFALFRTVRGKRRRLLGS